MTSLMTPTSAYFPRPPVFAPAAQVLLIAAAAGMTAMIWLSAIGGAGEPRPYIVAAARQASVVHVSLPPVVVTGRRSPLDKSAGLGSSGDLAADTTGCIEPGRERSAQKPG